MGLFFEGRPKLTMNSIVLVVSIFQAVALFSAGPCTFEEVCAFFTSGMPRPAVCGPLFVAWAIVCALYWAKIVKSPKLSTIVAAVFVYFGTATLIGQFSDPMGQGMPLIEYLWMTSVHVMEAYIGYAYFIESAICKYKIW